MTAGRGRSRSRATDSACLVTAVTVIYQLPGHRICKGFRREKTVGYGVFSFVISRGFFANVTGVCAYVGRSTVGPSSNSPGGVRCSWLWRGIPHGTSLLAVSVGPIHHTSLVFRCPAVWLLQGKSVVLNVCKSSAQWCSSDAVDIDYDLSPNFTSGKGQNILSFQNVSSPVLERITHIPAPNLQGLPYCS